MTWIWDGHNDYPWSMRMLAGYDLDRYPFDQPRPELQTDLARLDAGGVGAQFWSVFVPCSLRGGNAVAATLEQVAFVRRLVSRYPGRLAHAASADEVAAVVAGGRVACLTGIEGGHQIDGSLDVLDAMHALGVRYLTLTHNENVAWADSATDRPVLGGLSDFGRLVVRRMNDLGMFVDLSHVSDDVMRQAMDVTKAPVIFSHSSARAVCDSERNVPDDVLTTLAGNGGVCMVTFVPMFVNQAAADWFAELKDTLRAAAGDPRDLAALDPSIDAAVAAGTAPEATIADVVAHCEHIREVAGVASVGLGGDYDGCTYFPTGLPDVGGYPRLLDALRASHWSEADVEALAHGNVSRAMRDMQSVAVRR
jgi:membrane dipeptidase